MFCFVTSGYFLGAYNPITERRNRRLQRSDILRFIVSVTIGCVFWNDLIDGHSAPLRNIEITNELIPLFKAILPAIHLGVATLPRLAGKSLRIDAWSCLNASGITQAQSHTGHTGGSKQAFMHKERQGINRVETILYAIVVEVLSQTSCWRMVAGQHLIDKCSGDRWFSNHGPG